MTDQRAAVEPVRVGVVGVGDFGRLHAVTLAGLGEAELVAVVDRRSERLERLGRELPGVGAWTDLAEALAQSSAEAWVVAASTAAHVPAARAVLAAGKAALVEKPLAASLAEAETLGELVRADSSNLMVGHITLFGSEFRQLMAEAGRRGPIRFLDAVRHRPVAQQARFPGESPFHLTMVHDLYQVQALAGGREPVALHGRQRRSAGGGCDLALAELTWADGMVARLTASMLTPMGMPHDGYDRLEVFGEGWAARLQPNPRPIELWDERAVWPMSLETGVEDGRGVSGMLAEELRCFCRVVRGAEAVPAGARYADAMQVMRWLDRLTACAEGREREMTHAAPGESSPSPS